METRDLPVSEVVALIFVDDLRLRRSRLHFAVYQKNRVDVGKGTQRGCLDLKKS